MSSLTTSRPAVIICALMFAGGLMVLVSVWRAYFLDSRLQAEGPRAIATVVKKELLRSADGDSDFLVSYRFQLPDGRAVDSLRSLPKSQWKALTVGSTMVVVYSPEQPKRNFLESGGVSSIWGPVLATLVFGSLAAFGGAVIITLLRRDLRSEPM